MSYKNVNYGKKSVRRNYSKVRTDVALPNLIEIQTDIGSGLPDFDIVGLPDTTMKEAKKRIKTAIKNSGIEFPNKKILINLAPANIRKEGSCFDLAMAVRNISCYGENYKI